MQKRDEKVNVKMWDAAEIAMTAGSYQQEILCHEHPYAWNEWLANFSAHEHSQSLAVSLPVQTITCAVLQKTMFLSFGCKAHSAYPKTPVKQ